MIVNLLKEDLICLVKGVSPNYHIMDKLSKYGSFSGSYGRWTWSETLLEKLSEEELFGIYISCKQSWKK